MNIKEESVKISGVCFLDVQLYYAVHKTRDVLVTGLLAMAKLN